MVCHAKYIRNCHVPVPAAGRLARLAALAAMAALLAGCSGSQTQLPPLAKDAEAKQVLSKDQQKQAISDLSKGAGTSGASTSTGSTGR